MKNKKKQVEKLELDTEIVADLGADDATTEAIQGGGRSGVSGVVWQGRSGVST